MSKNYTICIGSVGGGLSCSPDGGDTWNRIRTPLPQSATFEHFMSIPMGPREFWQALMAVYLRVKIMGVLGHIWNLPWKARKFGL